MADTRRVEDEDLDKIDQSEDKKEPEEKKKVNKKPRIKVDPGVLVDSQLGLRSLYKRMHNDKNFNLKGKGNEVGDFNKVMNQLRAWHFESMTKLDVGFFAERVAKVG